MTNYLTLTKNDEIKAEYVEFKPRFNRVHKPIGKAQQNLKDEVKIIYEEALKKQNMEMLLNELDCRI